MLASEGKVSESCKVAYFMHERDTLTPCTSLSQNVRAFPFLHFFSLVRYFPAIGASVKVIDLHPSQH